MGCYFAGVVIFVALLTVSVGQKDEVRKPLDSEIYNCANPDFPGGLEARAKECGCLDGANFAFPKHHVDQIRNTAYMCRKVPDDFMYEKRSTAGHHRGPGPSDWFLYVVAGLISYNLCVVSIFANLLIIVITFAKSGSLASNVVYSVAQILATVQIGSAMIAMFFLEIGGQTLPPATEGTRILAVRHWPKINPLNYLYIVLETAANYLSVALLMVKCYPRLTKRVIVGGSLACIATCALCNIPVYWQHNAAKRDTSQSNPHYNQTLLVLHDLLHNWNIKKLKAFPEFEWDSSRDGFNGTQSRKRSEIEKIIVFIQSIDPPPLVLTSSGLDEGEEFLVYRNATELPSDLMFTTTLRCFRPVLVILLSEVFSDPLYRWAFLLPIRVLLNTSVPMMIGAFAIMRLTDKVSNLAKQVSTDTNLLRISCIMEMASSNSYAIIGHGIIVFWVSGWMRMWDNLIMALRPDEYRRMPMSQGFGETTELFAAVARLTPFLFYVAFVKQFREALTAPFILLRDTFVSPLQGYSTFETLAPRARQGIVCAGKLGLRVISVFFVDKPDPELTRIEKQLRYCERDCAKLTEVIDYLNARENSLKGGPGKSRKIWNRMSVKMRRTTSKDAKDSPNHSSRERSSSEPSDIRC